MSRRPFVSIFAVLIAWGTLLLDGTMAMAKVTDEDLRRIKLPPGFSISVVSDEVPGARQMALSPAGTLFVGTRTGGKVFALKSGARLPIIVASDLDSPNGVAIKNGDLYVAEISRILKFPSIEAHLVKAVKPQTVFRADYPKDEHHGWKSIAFGPDGWLYVPVGAPCNRCVEDNEIYASINRLSPDGKKREIVARGVRNTVGFDWQPSTRELWFTDNGADHLGDDVPGDELNRAAKTGLHFGFPYCHQGDFKDPQFGRERSCGPEGEFQAPVQKLGPHVAALGMKFYGGKSFPEKYRGGVFIAEHGSWNRSKKVGYRVMFVPVSGKDAKGYEVFAEGWLQGEKPWGRPVDILTHPDGSILVSDDFAGAIYRISYRGAASAKEASSRSP